MPDFPSGHPRWSWLLSGILFVIIIVLLIRMSQFQTQLNQLARTLTPIPMPLTSMREQVTTAVWRADIAQLEQSWILTRIPGLAGIPPSSDTLKPEEFVATVTAVAKLSQWMPIIREFDGYEMVQVPAGCFFMGSALAVNEKPVHEICFNKPLWIDRFEVSRSQYQVCLDASICTKPHPSQTPFLDDHPVNFVNWFQAKSFCNWRSARLPTEAEWEYTARGPNSPIYTWGNDFTASNTVYFDNSFSQIAQVGEHESGVSWVGAHDMSGNVWEWVSTIFDPILYSYPYVPDDGREDPEQTDMNRGIRGGSFRSSETSLRVANREGDNPYRQANNTGFRCVLSTN